MDLEVRVSDGHHTRSVCLAVHGVVCWTPLAVPLHDVTEPPGPLRPPQPEVDVNDPTDGRAELDAPRASRGDLVVWLAGGSLARMLVGGVALVPLWWLYALRQVVESRWVAHLVSRGARVADVTRADTGWCVRADDGALVHLAADDVRGGIYYECHDGHGGFSPPEFFGVLALRLSVGRIVLVGPPEAYGEGGRVGDLARELLADGRIRGPWHVRSRPSPAAMLLVPLSVPWIIGAWALWRFWT